MVKEVALPDEIKKNLGGYRDFIIFEERLKYSLKVIKFRQRQYYAMLGALSILIAYFCWLLNWSRLKDPFWITTNKFMLFILCSVFLMILNSEHVWQPRRFIPRVNRALTSYKMEFQSKRKVVNILSDNINNLSEENKKSRELFQNGLIRFRDLYHRKLDIPSSKTNVKLKD